MGVSAAGKTSVGTELAKRLGVPFVDADDLHPATNRAKMTAGEPLTDTDRAPWLERVAHALRGSGGAVIACSALKRAYRDQLRGDGDIEVGFVLLEVPSHVLERRLCERADHFMPTSLLEDQLATLERPDPDETDVWSVAATAPLESVVDTVSSLLDIKAGRRPGT